MYCFLVTIESIHLEILLVLKAIMIISSEIERASGLNN